MNNLRQHEEIATFLKQVCREIKAKEVHKEVRLELESHLQELIEEKLSAGVDMDTAVKDAISKWELRISLEGSFILLIGLVLTGGCLPLSFFSCRSVWLPYFCSSCLLSSISQFTRHETSYFFWLGCMLDAVDRLQ